MAFLESLDNGVTGLFGQWNLYSTGLVTLLIAIVGYRVVASREPDIHPMLLARQAIPSPVRNEGESPVYRCQAAPHGMPLNSGLNVKEPGASKWSQGKDGDLRDVWKKVIAGTEDGGKGKLLTVLGAHVIEHKLGRWCGGIASIINKTDRSRRRHPADQLDRTAYCGPGWY